MLTVEQLVEKSQELGFSNISHIPAEHLFERGREVKRRINEGLIPDEPWADRNMQSNPKNIMSCAKEILILIRSYKPFLQCFPHSVPIYSRHYQEYPIGFKQAVAFTDWMKRLGVNAQLATNLPLKSISIKAGLGIYRRNSLVYIRESGSFIILYAILIDQKLDRGILFNNSSKEYLKECGDCNICINLCPTGAIKQNGVIDLNKCIRNYMGSGRIIPDNIKIAYGTKLLGCEICQRVCPKNSKVLKESTLLTERELNAFSLVKLLDINESSWRETRKNISSIIGRNYTRQNRILNDAIIVAGNLKDPCLLKYLKTTLKHSHIPIRAHSAWSIGRIGTKDAKHALLEAFKREDNLKVRLAIENALNTF